MRTGDSLPNRYVFTADVQQADGSFDGIEDKIIFKSRKDKLIYVDGATGKRHQIDMTKDDQGTRTAYARLDMDGDGDADPYMLVEADGELMVQAALDADETQAGSRANLVSNADRRVVLKDYPKPQVGEWGLDMGAMDRSVDPGDDFYTYVNGTWQKNTVIPDDKAGLGVTTDIYYSTLGDVQAITEDILTGDHPEGSDAKKIKDYFNAFIDMEAINAAGLTPFQEDLDFIANIATRDDLIRAFGQSGMRGYSAPLDFGIGVDKLDPTKKTIYVGFGGLIQGSGSRDYYLKDEHAEVREAFKAFTAYALEYSGQYTAEEAQDYAQKILDLETEMAKLTWPKEQYRNPVATYNPVNFEQLKASAPNYDWDLLFKSGKLPEHDHFAAVELKDFQKMADLIEDTPIDVWQAHMTFQLLNGAVSLLPEEFQDARFEMYVKPKYGYPQQTPRERMAFAKLNDSLGEAIGKYYVEKHFPAAYKQDIEGLVENLRMAYHQVFQDNTWLDEQTKAAALTKLDKMWAEVGYPSDENWKDYSQVDIRPGDAAGNERRLRQYEMEKSTREFKEPVNQGEWLSPPQEVNAHFIPSRNKIVFMAGYLQAPNYDPNADPAVNYGAIGSTIGHEMGHAFDDMGSQFDEAGRLQNWWTDETRAEFERRVSGLVEQFNQYEPLPGLNVNGELTLGENIGDLVGLYIAYEAYQISLNGQEAPVINGLTGDQRFFMSYAQSHRAKRREGSLRNQVMTDPHSPDDLRTNGILRNFDPWYESFDVSPQDDMYLPPEQRVDVWWD